MTTDAFHQTVLVHVEVFAKAQRLTLYVVGGVVRDALLGRERLPDNIDLAIPSRALDVAHLLAKQLEGTYICLDEAAGSARIVVTSDAGRVALDLSDFRGPTLEEDLARRDFTINALAVPLEVWNATPQWSAHVIDPLDGRADLARQRLLACSEAAFREDPVRILRAFRFAVQLGFTFDPSLQPLMRAALAALKAVSGERIRDELMAILASSRSGWALGALNELGALDALFPELSAGRGVTQGGYHHLDVLEHQLEAVAQCDRMLTDFAEFDEMLRGPLAQYCASALVEGRPRAALIKLAALFHDVGKPATRRVEADGEIWFIGHEQFGATLVESPIERLRLSKREGELVQRLVLYHLRPGHLSREPQLSRRAIFRFFRDLDEDGPACLVLWWADRLATRGPSSRLDQIDQQRARLEELLRAYFFKAQELVTPPRLLDGHALMAQFHLKPGPLVGELLGLIEEAQAEGQLHSKEDALALAEAHLRNP